MSKETSNKIYYATFIMAILVMAIHSSFTGFLDPEAVGYHFSFATQKVFLTLGDAAVPTFFVISGYLLFNNYILKDYPRMLLKKLFSLVIPYFLWSVLGFLVTRIIIPAIRKEVIELTFQSVALDILLSNGCPQIWFIRPLVVFCICSPLLYFIFKYLKKWSIFIPITIFVIYIFFMPNYFGVLFWIPLFFVGCYLSYFKIPVMNHFKPRLIAVISLILLLVIASLIAGFFVIETSKIYFVYRHLSVVLLWLSFDVLFSLYQKESVNEVFKISAFLFFFHFPIAQLFGIIFRMGISITNYNCVLLFFLTWIVTSIISVSIGYMLKRFVNPLYLILAGRK